MTEQPPGRPEQAPDAPAKDTAKTAKDTAKAAATSATEAPSARRRPRLGSPRYGRRRVGDALATAVVIVAVAVAIILAVHVVFVVFEANGANGIVKTINSWADSLAWSFKDIFTPTNPKTAALVNYGLAAVIYLIAGRVVAAVLRRLG
ncbi:MAG TPA: hypothetical protein VFU43_08270 [Streptosporangiaceae bacterium]|nr:hypothetical protein [Streptosporangiaceae bacterium]